MDSSPFVRANRNTVTQIACFWQFWTIAPGAYKLFICIQPASHPVDVLDVVLPQRWRPNVCYFNSRANSCLSGLEWKCLNERTFSTPAPAMFYSGVENCLVKLFRRRCCRPSRCDCIDWQIPTSGSDEFHGESRFGRDEDFSTVQFNLLLLGSDARTHVIIGPLRHDSIKIYRKINF